MKFSKNLFCIIALSGMLTGCQSGQETENTQEDTSVTEETVMTSTTEAEPVSRNIFYLTSHDTQSVSELTKFITQLETDGFTWQETEISEIPADADMLIYHSPKEDLTAEEYALLDEYMNQGGDLLLLLPPSESETRYKFLNNLLEDYCLGIDYDLITETDQNRIQPDGSIQLQAISYPDRMLFYDESMSDGIVYMQNMRSFHMLSEGSNMEIYMDSMLQTSQTVVGSPYGGTEDDPLTYENQVLNIMLYSRDAMRSNSAVVVVGSADFLLDENFDAETSQAAKHWIYSSLNWFTAYD